MSLFSELKRRNVLRMAALYVIAAWLVMQVAEVIIGLAGLTEWVGQTVLVLLAIGFPIALLFSWFYELTSEGLSLEKDVAAGESITQITGRRMDIIVIAVLCAAVILFAVDKWWIGSPPEQSIAVLPFKNMSGDPAQEYFSDGISEELLNVLAKLPGLRVAARTSSFQFKGQQEDIIEIASQLNVAHILEGSVRKFGDRLRITAQLIKADDGYHLWSETYDRKLDDVFAVQEEIARRIGDALKVKLVSVEGDAMSPTIIKTTNTDAYDAYLQGRELVRLRGQQNLENAVRKLEHSLRLDANFAPAHAQLAIASMLLINTGELTQETKRLVTSYLDRAQELEPDLAETHAARALLVFDNNPESAIEYARKALASNPSYVDAMTWSLLALQALGRYEESFEVYEQIFAVDPLSVIGRFNYSIRLGKRGRVEDAHALADELAAQSPVMGYLAHADVSLFYEGKIAEGLSWALNAQAVDRSPNLQRAHVAGFIWIGLYEEARRVAGELIYLVDVAEGRFEEAIEAAETRLHSRPQDRLYILMAANILYAAGQFSEALPLYESVYVRTPEGGPIVPWTTNDYSSNEIMMRLALARRKEGDTNGAEAAVKAARQDIAARRAAGRTNQFLHRADAMIAAFENDADQAIVELTTALDLGLRDPQFFADPVFAELRSDRRFTSLRKKLDGILRTERRQVLELICLNNPTPENWQPLPDTCASMEKSTL